MEKRKKLATLTEASQEKIKFDAMKAMLNVVISAEPGIDEHHTRLLAEKVFDSWLNNMIDVEIQQEKIDLAVKAALEEAEGSAKEMKAKIEELEIKANTNTSPTDTSLSQS